MKPVDSNVVSIFNLFLPLFKKDYFMWDRFLRHAFLLLFNISSI
ncbi:hypothetical protein LEP1GSC064_1801 [Leptospira kirschneri serovar Grippotyphosa str. Moskva]|nr:hypothetical protein LEP1GSC064_1801 [Leptospira kirschneri serovar Grippotyphosa str. Moskva]EKR07496.1 hypothetical protein LEP1GSC122_2441 [Leptospira kirschneri serovar Valbuzzi str. 200702274]